jgi:hypothetical protein
VVRMPPEGNDEASGSLWMSCAPTKRSSTLSSPGMVTFRSMNESCFSAVSPFIGWNQCVKCVAPWPVAQSRATEATASAASGGSGAPVRSVASRAW